MLPGCLRQVTAFAASGSSFLHVPVQPGQGGADILPLKAPALKRGGQPLERGPVRRLAPELGGQKFVDGLLRVRQLGQGVVPQVPPRKY